MNILTTDLRGSIMPQLAIPILSALAVWRLAGRHRDGWWLSLASQPFWFYAATTARQWGILALSVLYTVAAVRGLWNWPVDVTKTR
jgi:hypothetical protein